MPLPCEICSSASGATTSSSFTEEYPVAAEFTDGAALRAHLVEEHAKFVAEALLAPKLNDKTHIWLLANVDYTAEGANGTAINCKEEIDDLTHTSDGEDTSLEAPPAQDDPLEALLKGFLQQQSAEGSDSPQLMENAAAEGDQQQTEMDFFGPLKSLLLAPGDGESSQQHSGDSTPSRAALVDSKAVRKAHCQMCDLDICSTARQRHVYMVHLKKRDLFKCPFCDYTNSNSMWEVQKHCRMQHGTDTRPISQEEHHKLEIQMWNHLCFPEWKQKPQKRRLEEGGPPEPEEAKEEKDSGLKRSRQTTEEPEALADLVKQELEAKETDRGQEEEEDEEGPPEAEGQRTSAEGAEVNDRLCHLCMEESKYPGRHIAQRHLKRPLYECPVCHKFGSYESCTVNKHIQKVHPKEARRANPISNLEKYADEIRDLQARCFPNRQMKLVRPVSAGAKSRPRERHHCGLCKADVAQSDRQRHVFHKHLRKGKIFECPLCDFSSNYDIHRVKWHIKWDHKDYLVAGSGQSLDPISHEAQFREEIDSLNEQCFPGWQRKRQFPGAEEAPQQTAELEGTAAAELDGLMQKALRTVAEAMRREGCGALGRPETPERFRLADPESNQLEWTCQLCRSALKPGTNLLRHVAKDHLNLPLYQCPVCENHGAHSAYEVRSHMLRSHGSSAEEPLSSLEENLADVERVWRECFPWKEFKAATGGADRAAATDQGRPLMDSEARVRCRECGQEMKTEDRQIHVYRHHLREPRLYECPVCDFSHYACSSDVRNHIQRAHKTRQEVMPRANLLRYSKEIAEWNERCFPGWINRRLPASVVEDFNSCRLCGMDVRQTSRHIAEHHLHIPLHQCPLCEYGAAEARLVQRHMRNNHTLKECEGLEPIANVEKRRAEFSELHNQCFPGRPKRLSNITIADESRRAKCRGCGMTISKKRRLVHLLERHLRKPVYKCKHCLFSSTHERAAVEAHQRDKHSGKQCHVLSNLYRHKSELRRLATECFNEPELKLEDS